MQLATPVGEPCAWCDEAIEAGQQGSYIHRLDPPPRVAPVHKECSFRNVMGGIGHLEDHEYWCKQRGDPDGGRSRRQSALEVWAHYQQWGLREV